MENIYNGFFIKENHYGKWQEAKIRDFKALINEDEKPFTKEEKGNLPQFGIGKENGSKKNQQLFPTNFIITELDVPHSEKEELSTEEKINKWSPIFIEIFEKIKADKDIHYWAMYLTSSMCGIRFILKMDNPIYLKSEYESISKSFLIGLEKFGINKECIDIAVNKAWYIPTFKKYFDHRRKRIPIINFHSDTNKFKNLFHEALTLTEKKEKFTEGNRNNFIHQLACNTNRYGIDRLDTIHMIEENGYNYEPKEVEATVSSVYQNNQSEFGKLKQKQGVKEATVPLNQQIKKLKSMPPIPLIWSGIKQGSVGFVFGPAKSGKSTFCECLAMALASGMDKFMDTEIKGGPYKVMFISMEEHWQMRAERNEKQRNFLYSRYGKKYGNMLISSTEKYPNFVMSDRDLQFIENEIKISKPQIVIIDSLSHIIIDRIEESSNTNKMLLKVKEMASNYGITLIIIHHSTKNRNKGLGLNNLAGSRIIGQEGDFIIGINKVGETRYLKEVAFRYAESSEMAQTFRINESRWIEPLKLEYENDILKGEDGRTDTTNGDLIYDFILEQEEVRTQEIIDSFRGQISKKTIHNQLKKLIEDGKIEKVEKGVYKIPSVSK